MFTRIESERLILRRFEDFDLTPSVALLERLGMRREGHFVENNWFKGRWADEYLYAVLRHEWLSKWKQESP